MPYVVNKCGDKYCVYKVGNKKKALVSGGKHNTMKEAQAHATAMRIGENK